MPATCLAVLTLGSADEINLGGAEGQEAAHERDAHLRISIPSSGRYIINAKSTSQSILENDLDGSANLYRTLPFSHRLAQAFMLSGA